MRKPALTDEEKELIRKLHKDGMPYTALAARYNVSSATIMRACRPDIYEQHKAAVKNYNAINSREIYERRKTNSKRYALSLHLVNDADIIEHLDSQENVQGYLRELIQKDIEDQNIK